MNITYKVAWKEGETALFIDGSSRKYAAKNGNLAWRINNPGLVKHHCRLARKNGSIGAWDNFAIFSNPFEGHQALKNWLQSKAIFKSDLHALAKHYRPESFEELAQDLTLLLAVPKTTRIIDLTPAQFESLVNSIQKLCGFFRIGNEEFFLLPKIAAKIECPENGDLYLVGTDLTLTHREAINWVDSHRLDAVVVHRLDGSTYLRSRPRYQMQTLRLTWQMQYSNASKGQEIPTLARKIGEKVERQCIWGFVNGIRNTKEDAIESCNLISTHAKGEEVLTLCNDSVLQGVKEVGVAILLKIGVDTPIIRNAVQFLRYLLALSEQQNHSPVIIFAHSQGAAIIEHAIFSLSNDERKKIRIFTFGGWSFIPPDTAHPDSHNYASAGDLVSRMGSFNLQYLAIRRYEGLKKGLNLEQIISGLSFADAISNLDCFDTRVVERYARERSKYYKEEFKKISNLTVLDSGSLWEHSFNNKSYQAIVCMKIDQYRTSEAKAKLERDPSFFLESFV